ncbi:MAG TPA: ankyrin repeat domain-containing protein [Longimicrobiaceae bacterium]|nr:ankyrin repeat domain-containing protein [Longimicrobiaceae bacterium]
MPSRTLPARPSLAQLRTQARELLRDHRAGSAAAAGRIAAHHPRLKGHATDAVLAEPLKLADAQLVLAREYGLPGWPALKHRVEMVARIAQFQPHPRFAEALAAFDAGDAERLRALLAADPSLARARTNLDPPYGYFSAATLLHHAAGNPGREQRLPANVVELARVLLDAGAEVDAETIGPNGGTTMGLLITSKQASDRGFSGPLMDLLLERGARLDLHRPDALDPALANHAPRAAERMIELGAKADIFAAAALGRLDLLRAMFGADGRLLARPRRRGRLMSARDAIGLAMLYAYVAGRREAVDFLLEKDGNWNMTGVNNGTAMHRAAWDGDLEMVQRLIARGADIYNRDNPWDSTPLSWAQHNRQFAVFDWMRANTRVDLHEAVGFGLLEHVEARLREDPSSVNRQVDHWEVPRSTPLHWAAWPSVNDVEGTIVHDVDERLRLVTLLLDAGADPNLVAGDGSTPLDYALIGKAERVAALLRSRGAKRAAEL